VLEKPFSLETLRKKLLHIQGSRRVSGTIPRIVPTPDAAPAPVEGMKIDEVKIDAAGETAERNGQHGNDGAEALSEAKPEVE
jgi:hypothetical protein